MANGTRACPGLRAIPAVGRQTCHGMPGQSIGLTAAWRYRVPQWCPSRSACSPSLPTAARLAARIARIHSCSMREKTSSTLRPGYASSAKPRGLVSCRCICRAGGEPGARRDLVDITAGAHTAGLYTNLITSAVGITAKTLRALTEAGLDHVQISIQDSDAASADHIAGYDGAFSRKRALAAEVV